MASQRNDWVQRIRDHGDVVLGAAVFGVLMIMLAPLSPAMMDLLLVTSISGAVLLFLTTLFTKRAVDLTAFPTLLLVATVYRLSLNVASTRLILLAGHNGPGAAGKVIEAFGQFVVGGNFVVGLVVFAILVVINFVVITKGAGRVAEVAARFTLDAMPGKQMAIDSELNAGLIDETTARARRSEITREAEFYGAMDGASKFVRGDAIAGIIITVVNIVGGVFVGVVQNDLALGEAAQLYTVLTIGDGLVGQVPALIVSTAAGILVTRVQDARDNSLDAQLFGQVLRNPRILVLTSAGLATFALIPGLRIPFLVASAAMGFIAWQLRDLVPEDQEGDQDDDTVTAAEAQPKDLLALDPLALEVGVDLLYLVDERQGGTELAQRIQRIRQQFATDLGVVLPPVHLRDDLDLEPGTYVIRLRGEEIGRGTVHARRHLALDSGATTGPVKGIKTTDPVFGLPATWIADNQILEAQRVGFTVVDVPTVITTHFMELMHLHAYELLDGTQLSDVLDRLGEENPRLVEDLVPDPLPRHAVLRVFRNLVQEGLSTRDAQSILEALADHVHRTRDPDVLTEMVRQRLARHITRRFLGPDGVLHYISLNPEAEDQVLRSLQTREGSAPVLVLDPGAIRALVTGIHELMAQVTGPQPVLIAPPLARGPLRRMLSRSIPRIAVLSTSELLPDVRLNRVGAVGVRAA